MIARYDNSDDRAEEVDLISFSSPPPSRIKPLLSKKPKLGRPSIKSNDYPGTSRASSRKNASALVHSDSSLLPKPCFLPSTSRKPESLPLPSSTSSCLNFPQPITLKAAEPSNLNPPPPPHKSRPERSFRRVPKPCTPPKPRLWDQDNGFQTFEVESLDLDLDLTITCHHEQDAADFTSDVSTGGGAHHRLPDRRSKSDNTQHSISLGHVVMVMNDLERSALLTNPRKKLCVRYSVDQDGNRSLSDLMSGQEESQVQGGSARQLRHQPASPNTPSQRSPSRQNQSLSQDSSSERVFKRTSLRGGQAFGLPGSPNRTAARAASRAHVQVEGEQASSSYSCAPSASSRLEIPVRPTLTDVFCSDTDPAEPEPVHIDLTRNSSEPQPIVVKPVRQLESVSDCQSPLSQDLTDRWGSLARSSPSTDGAVAHRQPAQKFLGQFSTSHSVKDMNRHIPSPPIGFGGVAGPSDPPSPSEGSTPTVIELGDSETECEFSHEAQDATSHCKHDCLGHDEYARSSLSPGDYIEAHPGAMEPVKNGHLRVGYDTANAARDSQSFQPPQDLSGRLFRDAYNRTGEYDPTHDAHQSERRVVHCGTSHNHSEHDLQPQAESPWPGEDEVQSEHEVEQVQNSHGSPTSYGHGPVAGVCHNDPPGSSHCPASLEDANEDCSSGNLEPPVTSSGGVRLPADQEAAQCCQSAYEATQDLTLSNFSVERSKAPKRSVSELSRTNFEPAHLTSTPHTFQCPPRPFPTIHPVGLRCSRRASTPPPSLDSLVEVSSADPKVAAKVAAMLKVHFGFIPQGYRVKNQDLIDPLSFEMEMEKSIQGEVEALFQEHSSSTFAANHQPTPPPAPGRSLLKSVLLHRHQNRADGPSASPRDCIISQDHEQGEGEDNLILDNFGHQPFVRESTPSPLRTMRNARKQRRQDGSNLHYEPQRTRSMLSDKEIIQEVERIGYQVNLDRWTKTDWKILEGCLHRVERKKASKRSKLKRKQSDWEGDSQSVFSTDGEYSSSSLPGNDDENGMGGGADEEEVEPSDVVLKMLKVLDVDVKDCQLEWEWSKMVLRVVALQRRRSFHSQSNVYKDVALSIDESRPSSVSGSRGYGSRNQPSRNSQRLTSEPDDPPTTHHSPDAGADQTSQVVPKNRKSVRVPPAPPQSVEFNRSMSAQTQRYFSLRQPRKRGEGKVWMMIDFYEDRIERNLGQYQPPEYSDEFFSASRSLMAPSGEKRKRSFE